MKNLLLFFLIFSCLSIQAQHNHDHDHDHDHNHEHHGHEGHNRGAHDGHDHGNQKHDDHAHGQDAHSHGAHHGNNFASDCGSPAKPVHHVGYDPAATAIHHISDANVLTIMDMVRIPLPAILYNKDRGLEFFSTAKFKPSYHDDGHYGFRDYVLFQGNIHRLKCAGFNGNEPFQVDGFDTGHGVDAEGKEFEKRYAIVNGRGYLLEQKTIWDGGLLGGGVTSFYDFSPTKNVVTMGIVALLLFLMFRSVAKAYTRNDGQAPSGLQSLLEPMVVFIREEVAIPFLKHKHKKYLPLLLSIFFLILGLNLWGQVPFLGSVNVSGSLTVTMVMAVIVFIITNVSGNKHYWGHLFAPPGAPWFVKIILIPVEILGLFIKPLTLMLRLAGNISAGHIAILSFVGLIFIFGKAGTNLSGSLIGTGLAIPLTLFMMAIELIVAFIQAYVFTILTASYIGAAVDDHDDHH